MTAQADFLDEARAVIAAMTIARDPTATFLEHATNQPFETAPISGIESFHIRPRAIVPREWFGTTGVKSFGWIVEVLLGHAPYTTERGRENFATADINKVSELELYAWTTVGVDGVFFEGAETDRANSSWWISTLRFRIELSQAKVT